MNHDRSAPSVARSIVAPGARPLVSLNPSLYDRTYSPRLTTLWLIKPYALQNREEEIAAAIVGLQTNHWEWSQAMESQDLGGWTQALLVAQRTWKKIEKKYSIDQVELARKVNRTTSRKGSVLWNPCHWDLDQFKTIRETRAEGSSSGPRPANHFKRPSVDKVHLKKLAETMLGIKDEISSELGTLEQMALKRMRR